MEAFAIGVPAISSYHSGIPELVQNGVSGFLVEERDVDALKDKLIALISDPKLRFQMGRAGRRHVEKHYNASKLTVRLMNLYENLLNKNDFQFDNGSRKIAHLE
jgi:colanic acid/amylovoran biosynthesis glycosyltransferase